MNEHKRSYPVTHIGSSFLLVIFTVLCLVTFAILSLSSTLRNQQYSQKEATRTVAYYEANSKAQEQLGRIVQAFRTDSLDQLANTKDTADVADATDTNDTADEAGGADTTYTANSADAAGTIQIDTENEAAGHATVSYSVSINEEQSLDITVALSKAEDLSDGIYQITKWEEVTSSTWEGDTTLPIMGSDD